MLMVPGLSADMPSRVCAEEGVTLWPEIFPYDFLFEDFTSQLGSADFELPDNAFDDMDNSDSFPENVLLRRDCFFGKPEEQCLRECGQQCDTSNTDYPIRHLGCTPNVLTIANPCSQEEFLGMVNPQSVLPQQLPYSPYNDHCYYQTIGYPDCEIKDTSYSYESDSPSDDSADEIVDVETVQDKVEPPVAKVVKKRGRKPVKKFKFSNSKQVVLNNKRTTGVKRGNKVIQSGRVTKGRRRGKSSCEPSSASSSDAEEHGKRSNHNNMERHRRDEQKRMLQGLRVLVPAIKNNAKAPKVMILIESAKYISYLRSQEQSLLAEKQKYRRSLQLAKELLQRQSISKL